MKGGSSIHTISFIAENLITHSGLLTINLYGTLYSGNKRENRKHDIMVFRLFLYWNEAQKKKKKTKSLTSLNNQVFLTLFPHSH